MIPGDPRDVQRYFAYSQIGLEMVVPIIIGLVLDLLLHTLPWCVLVGVVLGPTVAFVHLIYLVNKDNKADSPPPPSNPRESR